MTLQPTTKISTPLFFLLLFAYQFIFSLQGIDFLDEGFSAAFFQQFFHDPASVQYNFLYWFSGVVGGVFVELFPGTGLLGLRVLSILCVMGTMLMVYHLLKDHINRGYLKAGLALVVLGMSYNPKAFHYNFLSILLYTGAISLLFHGIKKNKWWLFLLAGVLVALDTFTRLPSVLNLGLAVMIVFYGYLSKTKWLTILQQAFFFFLGFGIGLGAVLLVMKQMGHLDIYFNALRIISQMSQSDGETEYGLFKLLKQFLESYNTAFFFTVYILVLVLIAGFAPKYLREKWRIPQWITTGISIASLLVAAAIMLKGLEIVLRFYVGLTLITAVLILISRAGKEVKTLMLGGTYVTLTYAMGSSAGIFTAGVHIFWVAFPIGFAFLLGMQEFHSQVSFKVKQNLDISGHVFASPSQFRNIKIHIVVICVIACIYHQWFYPLHDESSRFRMRYAIDNKYVRGIYTIPERAEATNELLQQSARFIKEGDYVLMFHSFPLYHFMTKTRPYAGNSMPWYYQSAVFKDQLQQTYTRTKVLPVIVIQKIKTTSNDHASWPDNWPNDSVFHQPHTDLKTVRQVQYLEEFMAAHSYKVAWENELFKIMTADQR